MGRLFMILISGQCTHLKLKYQGFYFSTTTIFGFGVKNDAIVAWPLFALIGSARIPSGGGRRLTPPEVRAYVCVCARACACVGMCAHTHVGIRLPPKEISR